MTTTLTDDENILLSYVETSSTAMEILREKGYTGDCKRVVADVLRSGVLTPPDGFPCSRACIVYGRMIADHILMMRG